MGALLSADVEYSLFLQGEHSLEQQGALAYAGLSAEQDDAAGHESAAEHAVELVVVHVYAGVVVTADVREAQRAVLAQVVAGTGGGRGGCLAGRVGGHAHLLHRVPLSAGGALADPLGALLAAVAADVDGLVFGHSGVGV